MGSSADEVASLIDEDSQYETALGVVFDRTDGGTAEITWPDVKGDLSAGTWGRLIQRRILVEGTDGFRLNDPAALEQSLAFDTDDPDTEHPEESLPDTSWTTFDKAAGILAIVFFLGYSVPQERNFIAHTFDVLLGPLDTVLPFFVVILLLAVITGLYSSLLQSNLLDREAMGAYQQRMNSLQDRKSAAKERGDEAELDRIQEEQMEAMGDQMGMFKIQFRPTVWIMLLTIPVFLWMRWKLRTGLVTQSELQLIVPLAGATTLTEPLVGPLSTWIVWYFLCSMSFGQLMRKALNVSPTSPASD